MIISFAHKGLEKFYRTGSTQGIQPSHAKRLRLILGLLDVADKPQAMKAPSFKLHSLRGDLTGHWSVQVSGNWRITFRFTEQGVEVVNYLDYH